MYLREHTPLAKVAAGPGSANYTALINDLLRATGLLKVVREHDSEFVLLDSSLAECDRVGDGRAEKIGGTGDLPRRGNTSGRSG